MIYFLMVFNIDGPESSFRGLGARALGLVGGLDGLSDMLAEVRQLLQKKNKFNNKKELENRA